MEENKTEFTHSGYQGKETKTFTFTAEELQKHDAEIENQAYRKAAECTLENLTCLERIPIGKAFKNSTGTDNICIPSISKLRKEVQKGGTNEKRTT